MADQFEADRQRFHEAARAFVERHGEKGLEALGSTLKELTARIGASPEAAYGLDRSRYAVIIGDSKAMLEVLALVDRVAASSLPVLIQGESGTGKELIAKAIHENSNRRTRTFVTENCAAIPETLQESELFGYKRGAFTGADRDRKGLFEVANGGTLFLDEVGDMSPAMQTKLLRVLQDGEIRPVGGTRSLHVDVRVVSASNRSLTDMVQRQLFREDLYYRLNGVTVHLPPLRERIEDLPVLARHFIARIAGEVGIDPPELGDSARTAMMKYHWPGNIRELENEIRRCLALLGGEPVIEAESLGDEVRSA
ncbi:MAG: sigma 54-interacting transcriptional regulator [Planctomycetota bacterium]